MKFLNWNCNMAFRKKMAAVQAFDPDVMVVQECEAPDILEPYLGDTYQMFWTGQNKWKGLGVFVRKPFTAQPLPVETGTLRYMLPVRISGGINLIAFWAMNDKHDVKQRYIGQVWQGLSKCEGYISESTIVAGDFNWNLGFDANTKRKALYGTMGDVICFLREHQLFSVYHLVSQAEYGTEPDPTFLLHRCNEKAYHTDYFFLSKRLMRYLAVFEIGKFSDWATISDHVPIFAELVFGSMDRRNAEESC